MTVYRPIHGHFAHSGTLLQQEHAIIAWGIAVYTAVCGPTTL